MKNWRTILTLVLVLAALALPRGSNLDHFVTPDESKWLTRSANFFLSLAKRDFNNTYQKEHPGVTVMWAGTLGFLARYPSYVTQGPGQQDRPQRFKRYLDNHGVKALDLLAAGRAMVVAGIVITMALAYLAAVRLIGLLPAFIGFLLIAFDPFLIALSRLLHLDGLVSALMLLSLLAWLNYLYRGGHPVYLGLSAISAGLSWLTKSPALFLLPFIGLTLLIELGRAWKFDRGKLWAYLWRFAKPALIWTATASIVFVLLWPAMWVNPLHTLQQIFSGAASYASEGHDSITFFNGEVYQAGISDWRFYPVNYFWRATPAVIIGLLLLVLALALPRRFPILHEQKLTVIYLGLFVTLFTIFMTFGAKKFDRYLLPVFAPLDLLAGLGWVVILKPIWSQPRPTSSGTLRAVNWARVGASALLVTVIFTQAYSALNTHPYYFSYYNPLAGGSARAPQVMMIGWGEGLDQAARYLNSKPDAEKMRIASWYPDGPFSYIFAGETLQRDFPSRAEELPKSDYFVLYYHQWQRQLPSRGFLEYFAARTPEKIIYINGLEYARIYAMD